VHVLVSHPTPPVFDTAEDRNGKRNHDEIRFWKDYVNGATYMYDDAGTFGGLAVNTPFIIMGDQNADPLAGDSYQSAINQLLTDPLINDGVAHRPRNNGGSRAEQTSPNAGDPEFDTADFNNSSPVTCEPITSSHRSLGWRRQAAPCFGWFRQIRFTSSRVESTHRTSIPGFLVPIIA
jgi:hypothetical protein